MDAPAACVGLKRSPVNRYLRDHKGTTYISKALCVHRVTYFFSGYWVKCDNHIQATEERLSYVFLKD